MTYRTHRVSSKVRRSVLLMAGIACAAVFISGNSYAAAAADESPDQVALLKVLHAVPDRYQVLDEPHVAYARGADDIQVTTATVDVNHDPTVSAVLTSDSGQTVEVAFPFSDSATGVGAIHGDAIGYENGNGSTTIADPKADGALQVLTVISSPNAPTEYEYKLSLPAGTSSSVVDGNINFTAETGRLVAGIAPAWAIDSAGTAVPTWYELRGTTLVQVVDHSSDYVFPIVADPYLGQDLFSATGLRAGTNGFTDVWAQKSAFGQMVHQPLGGVHTFQTFGWDELRVKRPLVNVRGTYHHQYDCHTAGGFGNLAGTWDLEGHRVDKPGWGQGVVIHRCNW